METGQVLPECPTLGLKNSIPIEPFVFLPGSLSLTRHKTTAQISETHQHQKILPPETV
jgi:hypothetical protein